MPTANFYFRQRIRVTTRLRFAAAMMSIGFYASPASATEQFQTPDLSSLPIGSALQDFEFWRAGEPDPDHWTIVDRAAAENIPSIQQSGASREARPSLAIYKPVRGMNAKIRAQFKLIDGSMPSAGIAVRVTSPNDYYFVRASAFEQRLSFVHVVDGKSEEIANIDADIRPNHWQSLEVVVNGNGFKVSLDDRWAFTAFDYSKPASGQFGLWAERDDVTRFNQIEILSLTYADD